MKEIVLLAVFATVGLIVRESGAPIKTGGGTSTTLSACAFCKVYNGQPEGHVYYKYKNRTMLCDQSSHGDPSSTPGDPNGYGNNEADYSCFVDQNGNGLNDDSLVSIDDWIWCSSRDTGLARRFWRVDVTPFQKVTLVNGKSVGDTSTWKPWTVREIVVCTDTSPTISAP